MSLSRGSVGRVAVCMLVLDDNGNRCVVAVDDTTVQSIVAALPIRKSVVAYIGSAAIERHAHHDLSRH